MVELEEQVTIDGGCWLRFCKLPPAGEAPDAKKDKKKAPVEDAKPVYGRAWVSFADLAKPGENFTK